MEEVLMHLEGTDGKIDLYPSMLRIRREGLLSVGAYGKGRDIPISQISSIRMKAPETFSLGRIEFVLPSQPEPSRPGETAVSFTDSQREGFEELKRIIESSNHGQIRPESLPARRVLMRAVGVNGQIELTPSRVCIKRKGILGFATQGQKGEKEILISEITSVQFKKAGLARGYIQFAFSGGLEAKRGIFEGVHDENTVLFKLSQQPAFESLKRSLDDLMDKAKRPQATRQPTMSPLDELEKLASLRDKGIVSEEEFQAKKRQLLNL